jgi:hypothetical protein
MMGIAISIVTPMTVPITGIRTSILILTADIAMNMAMSKKTKRYLR